MISALLLAIGASINSPQLVAATWPPVLHCQMNRSGIVFSTTGDWERGIDPIGPGTIGTLTFNMATKTAQWAAAVVNFVDRIDYRVSELIGGGLQIQSTIGTQMYLGEPGANGRFELKRITPNVSWNGPVSLVVNSWVCVPLK
jgi:hypothetical protein